MSLLYVLDSSNAATTCTFQGATFAAGAPLSSFPLGKGTGNELGLKVLLVGGTASLGAVTNTMLTDFGAGDYETVAAGQTDQILGPAGAVGDYLYGLLLVPATAGCGVVSLKDGNGSAISIFAGGGTTALPTLAPIFVPIGARCVAVTTPGWKVTTGANILVIGIGNFT